MTEAVTSETMFGSGLISISAVPVPVASNHSDIHTRSDWSDAIKTDFIPLTRIYKKIDPHTDNGEWKGLLESDLPHELLRKVILKTGLDSK